LAIAALLLHGPTVSPYRSFNLLPLPQRAALAASNRHSYCNIDPLPHATVLPIATPTAVSIGCSHSKLQSAAPTAAPKRLLLPQRPIALLLPQPPNDCSYRSTASLPLYRNILSLPHRCVHLPLLPQHSIAPSAAWTVALRSQLLPLLLDCTTYSFPSKAPVAPY
jgi:hypothetical protein